MAGSSLALVSSIVQSPLGGFELRLFVAFSTQFKIGANLCGGWLNVSFNVKQPIKGLGYPSWSFIFLNNKQQATSLKPGGSGWAHRPQAGNNL